MWVSSMCCGAVGEYFYLAFPIQETVSLELSWSHYNLLARQEKSVVRQWYQQEAISQNWLSLAGLSFDV